MYLNSTFRNARTHTPTEEGLSLKCLDCQWIFDTFIKSLLSLLSMCLIKSTPKHASANQHLTYLGTTNEVT